MVNAQFWKLRDAWGARVVVWLLIVIVTMSQPNSSDRFCNRPLLVGQFFFSRPNYVAQLEVRPSTVWEQSTVHDGVYISLSPGPIFSARYLDSSWNSVSAKKVSIGSTPPIAI